MTDADLVARVSALDPELGAEVARALQQRVTWEVHQDIEVVVLQGIRRRPNKGPKRLQDATEAFQRRVVAEALRHFAGNRTHTAAYLGVSRQWLQTLLSRWDDR